MKRNKDLCVNIKSAGDYFCDCMVKNFRDVSQRIKFFSSFFNPNEIEFIIKTI